MSRLAGAIVAAAVMAGGPLEAWAGMSGNELLEKCSQAAGGSFNDGLCLGYIRGAVEQAVSEEEIQARVRSAPKGICLEKGITAGQLQAIALKHLRDHPEQRHYDAASTVSWAIQLAFPCDKTKK